MTFWYWPGKPGIPSIPESPGKPSMPGRPRSPLSPFGPIWLLGGFTVGPGSPFWPRGPTGPEVRVLYQVNLFQHRKLKFHSVICFHSSTNKWGKYNRRVPMNYHWTDSYTSRCDSLFHGVNFLKINNTKQKLLLNAFKSKRLTSVMYWKFKIWYQIWKWCDFTNR